MGQAWRKLACEPPRHARSATVTYEYRLTRAQRLRAECERVAWNAAADLALSSVCSAEECFDVAGELNVVLEQEAVRGVPVSLYDSCACGIRPARR